MRTILMLVPAVTLLVVGCSDEMSGPPFRPVADVSQLMSRILDPAADLVWDAVGTVITEDEYNEWQPETDEEWTAAGPAPAPVVDGVSEPSVKPASRKKPVANKKPSAPAKPATSATTDTTNADNISSGFAGAAFVVYLSGLTSVKFMKY